LPRELSSASSRLPYLVSSLATADPGSHRGEEREAVVNDVGAKRVPAVCAPSHATPLLLPPGLAVAVPHPASCTARPYQRKNGVVSGHCS
jgi:hypothetical protein